MACSIYVDHHVHGYVVAYLEERGVDCLKVRDDNHAAEGDETLLLRAADLGRVILTYDKDFLAIHARRLRAGLGHNGIIHVRPDDGTPRQILEDLAITIIASGDDEFINALKRVPL